MWFHCLLIFAFSGFFSLCKEQNLVMMALLRFYNISTLRVGGNTEFEGETQKKTWKFIALTNATKAMTTNTIFTMMPPDLLKPRQFPGQVAVWLFNFRISLQGFKCRFLVPLLGISKLRFGQRSLRRQSHSDFGTDGQGCIRETLWLGAETDREKKISGIQNFFSAFVLVFALCHVALSQKRSPWNIQNTRHQGHAWASVLAQASRVEADTWQLVLQTDRKNQHGSVLDNFLAWRDGREQKRTEAACCFSPARLVKSKKESVEQVDPGKS